MSSFLSVFDKLFTTSNLLTRPSWPKVLYGISFFSSEYYLSGLMDSLKLDVIEIHIILGIFTALGFLLFDSSLACIVLGLVTALAGTLAEIILINIFHLYHYNHADIAGICSWIPWVYLLGAPAVGNLFRRISIDFLH